MGAGMGAIEAEFDRLYPGKEPAHYGTEIHARAIFGGDNYLDGYSLYDSGEGYQHIVTFGMSELYTDEEAFGGEYSRWGYEMTIKLKEEKRKTVSGRWICCPILPGILIQASGSLKPESVCQETGRPFISGRIPPSQRLLP